MLHVHLGCYTLFMSIISIIIRQLKIIFALVLSVFIICLILSWSANPSTPLTFKLKRLQEKVQLYLRSNPESYLNYQMSLLNKRKDDIVFLVNTREYPYILTSSLRYSTNAGEITEFIIKNNMKQNIPATLDLFTQHSKIFKGLVEKYPKELNEEWKYIQDDINYLEIYSRMLDQDI